MMGLALKTLGAFRAETDGKPLRDFAHTVEAIRYTAPDKNFPIE